MGIGTYTYPDGAKYEGEWQNSERHGRGIWIRPDGTKYDGEWKNDKPNGQGTLTLPNGQKRIGLWKEGKLLEEKKPVESTGNKEQETLELQKERIKELELANHILSNEVKSLKEKLAEIEGKYQSDPFRDFLEDDYTAQLVKSEDKGSGRMVGRREKPARKKSKAWWFAAAGLLIILVIIVVGGREDKDAPIAEPGISGGENIEETTRDVEETLTPMVVTVDELVNELSTNALKATNTYKDQYVELTGKLYTIDSDGNYFSLGILTDEFTLDTITCRIEKEHLDTVMAFERDQIVTVTGTITEVDGFWGYTLKVETFK